MADMKDAADAFFDIFNMKRSTDTLLDVLPKSSHPTRRNGAIVCNAVGTVLNFHEDTVIWCLDWMENPGGARVHAWCADNGINIINVRRHVKQSDRLQVWSSKDNHTWLIADYTIDTNAP